MSHEDEAVSTQTLTSWGGVVRQPHRVVDLSKAGPTWRSIVEARHPGDAGWLPYGNGRSYGDSNLNPGGGLLLARTLHAIHRFDLDTGEIECDAGVLLSDILELVVPHGWFLAVVPGTCYVTVGGAIANDVHGKNHHVAGSFGHHVRSFELLRSDGSKLLCSADLNPEWFAATVGGLGLTGLITRATLQLRRIGSPWMDAETIRFRSLDEFFSISEASAQDWEYTVSWIDCASAGSGLGRGLFSRANHLAAGSRPVPAPTLRRMPLTPPVSLVNGLTLKAFNFLYYHRQRGDRLRAEQHYRPFFFPLDALLEWNRMYGPRGFYQYQCVVPDPAQDAVRQMLDAIAASGLGSFLAVLKQFGTIPSKGLLSFPRPGTTLALDFPNRGERLHTLFARLDRIVLDAGGSLYPAKDGRMDAAVFRAGYPQWREFSTFVDPRFSSGFWRRVNEA